MTEPVPVNVDADSIAAFVDAQQQRQDERDHVALASLAVLAGSQFLARYLARRSAQAGVPADGSQQPQDATDAPAEPDPLTGDEVSAEVRQNIARAKRLGRGPMGGGA